MIETRRLETKIQRTKRIRNEQIRKKYNMLMRVPNQSVMAVKQLIADEFNLSVPAIHIIVNNH